MGLATAIRPLAALGELLRACSTEVTPRDRRGIEAAGQLLAKGSEVFIAAVPGDGPELMISAAARLRALDLTPVPHLAARNFAGLQAFDRVLGGLRDKAGVDRVLALGGDRDRPAGDLHSSQQLIASGAFARRGVRKVFIACYPEAHPHLSAEVLEQVRAAKLRALADQGLEAELISQFCFQPGPVIDLARRLRAQGIQAPYRVGVAGPAERTVLVRYGLMCGIGPSLRALKQRQALARNVLAGETPEVLLTEIAVARAADPALGIGGVHLFTFGALERSARFALSLRG